MGGAVAPHSRRALGEALRKAVAPVTSPGDTVPSSRQLATDLGRSRTTVTDAYVDLVAEGWLTSRRGSGALAADRMITRPILAPGRRSIQRPCHNLIPSSPDTDCRTGDHAG